jgi:hypothetical protein
VGCMLIRQRRETLEAERFDPEVKPWPSNVRLCDQHECQRIARGEACYRVQITGHWFGIEPGSVLVQKPGRSMVVLSPYEFAEDWEVVEGGGGE